jgi:hypothetical protein
MAVRIATYRQAFNDVLGVDIDDKIKNLLRELENEGHTEKSICFSIWKSQDKLLAFKRDNRFIGILRNEVNKWSWPIGDARWQEYHARKNEEKKAHAIRKEIELSRKYNDFKDGKNKVLKKHKGFVYFVQGQCGGAIKIGYSVKPDERLKSLQTGYPDTLLILAMIPADEYMEKKLHREFEHCKLNGEWFRPDKMLIEKIKELSAVKAYA